MDATSRSDLSFRRNEVKELVAENDLETATLRLMDIVKDFNQGLQAINESKLIRAQYSHIRDEQRKLGQTDDVGLRRLRLEIMDFVDTLRATATSLEPRALSNMLSSPDDLVNSGVPELSPNLDALPLEVERKRFAAKWKASTVSTDTVLVVTDDVSRSFHSGEVRFQLDPISLEVRAGEITAIVGTNGSGKTTLLRLIAGDIRPGAGQILYPGLSGGKTSLYEIKRQIAYLPQALSPWSGPLLESLHFTAAIHGLRGEENQIETEFVLYRLGLERYKDAKWSQLSGGYRMRFALANALLARAKVLLLDEPLANLDVNAQSRFLRDLRSQADALDSPLGVVISSQHINQVEQIADHIIVLRDGKTIYHGAVKQFGIDRDENVFEVECLGSTTELRRSLEQLSYRQITREGNLFTIYTDRHVSAPHMLQALAQAEIMIISFRDISTSTRRIFLIDRDLP